MLLTLTADYYSQHTTVDLAQNLLGKFLVHQSATGTTVGRIIETEAYLADDPASHSFKGTSRRNASMFKVAGTSYVYLIYGIHFCFNVVSSPPGIGEAVLIRSLEPVNGIDLMRERRHVNDIYELCNGPGRLCQAMGIDKKLDGVTLSEPPIFIQVDTKAKPVEIHSSPRIGITKAKDLPLRFWATSRFVSK